LKMLECYEERQPTLKVMRNNKDSKGNPMYFPSDENSMYNSFLARQNLHQMPKPKKMCSIYPLKGEKRKIFEILKFHWFLFFVFSVTFATSAFFRECYSASLAELCHFFAAA